MKRNAGVKILSLLEGFPHPAMIIDRSFRIVAMNRMMEAITGYEERQVQGVHGELVVRSNVGNLRGQLYLKVLQSGEAISATGDILSRLRRKIPVQYTISLLQDDDNERCGLVVVVEDLSGREVEQQAVVRNEKAIELIGYSPKMQKIFDMIPAMAQTDTSIMITGETGTGKDKIAEILHQKSPRARFPFIKVNCGALPSGLLESELFGHVRGAFTGATRNKPGMFKLADKGTLFLTEIGDMPLPLQVKLLTVLDDRQFVPVGGEEKVSVDVRIIAATHRSLRDRVKSGHFRDDLFYRLNVLHFHLPPLREREGDVRYLLDHFLQRQTKALGKNIVGFSPGALQPLLSYTYPGNVRELSNIVEYAVNMCKRKKINKEHLPAYLFDLSLRVQRADEPCLADEVEGEESAGGSDVRTPRPVESATENWSDIERQMIVDALKASRGSKTKTAESLGWGRMTLWRKMKKYGLQD